MPPDPIPTDKQRQTWNIGRPVVLGVVAMLGLLAIFGAWSVRAQIAGAVIGSGVIQLSTSRTVVQHPIGGVVREILRHEGDRVAAGDVVLRLEDRVLQSDLTVTQSALFETLASIARLEAALEGRPGMILPDVLTRAENSDLLARQQRQLDDHFTAINTEMRLLDEQAAQIRAQIDGVAAQLAAKTDEQGILAAELVRGQTLSEQGLIRTAELTTLAKSDATVRGEIGYLQAQSAELRGKIAEVGLKRLAIVTDAAEVIGVELNRLRPERTRLLEARSSILQDLSLLDIRAPVAGRIIESQVQGLRSVVVAASPLMMIVPADEPVLAMVRIAATDIDQVYTGQEASLRFTAFNGRQIGILLGRVQQISADVFVDPATQSTHYKVAVAMDDAELAELGDLVLGMPVEVYLTSDSRTPISYLIRPIKFYFDRAFRDG